jgi:hypothetical protein
MNTEPKTIEEFTPNRFFSYAAWYSLLAPFAAAGITRLVIEIENMEGSFDSKYRATHAHACPIADSVEDIAFFVCISSFALGIASLFGIRSVGAGRILWKAVPGILASGFFATVAYLLMCLRVCRQ